MGKGCRQAVVAAMNATVARTVHLSVVMPNVNTVRNLGAES